VFREKRVFEMSRIMAVFVQLTAYFHKDRILDVFAGESAACKFPAKWLT